MPKPRKSNIRRNPLVAVLVYDGLCGFEFSCATEVFALPRPELDLDWYRFETCAAKRGPLRGRFGLRIVADAGLERLRDADTVIVPGWTSVDTPVPPKVVNALREAHARGARLVSICSGAFVLAATGLLDGKRATTHWRYADALRRMYPRVAVDLDVLYIGEDRIFTSAGSAAGLDLCLHLVRIDHGPAVANQVARRLVIAPHRDGGQAQFVERPVPKRETDTLSKVIEHMQRRLVHDQPIAELAALAVMSQRTFMRRFKDATGTTPVAWLVTARLARARDLLEGTSLPIDHVASECGFGSEMTLRHHFRRHMRTTPSAYRARFARSG
ncbi:MAG: transcriptional regulator FtrA [Rhodanobacteraceae bacterium]